MLGLFICMLAVGCTYETVVSDTWDQLRPDQGMRAGASANAKVEQDDAGDGRDIGFAIRLASFEGGGAMDEARDFADNVRGKTNMPGLWFADDGAGKVTVYRGRYMDPQGLAVMADLRQTRMIQIDGRQRFADAQVVSLSQELAPPNPETGATADMNLQRYFGKELWSLQVAIFNELYGSDYHKAAERAAAELRKKNFQAYYHHGPRSSSVTIGLFTYDEAWVRTPGQQDSYSPLIRQLQEQYPYTMFNGQPVRDGNIEQPSQLVILR